MKTTRKAALPLGALAILCSALVAGCMSAGTGNPNGNNNSSQCNLDGECTGDEDCFNCPTDCCTQCDLDTITPAQPRDYLVSALVWPETSTEAYDYGLDLDGDDGVDNKVGAVMGLLAANDAALNGYIARRINSGDLMFVLRVWVDDLEHDDVVAVQMLPATSDSTPLFDGLDEVRIATASPTDRYACGTVSSSQLLTDPADESQPLPSPMGKVANDWMRFHRMRFAGDLAAEQLSDIIVAGAIDEYDVQHVLLPDIAAMLTEEIATNPDHEMVDALRQVFDGECDSSVPGCEDVVRGEGECDDSAVPAVITSTELRCNNLMHVLSAPDMDTDGDGEYDLLSGAWRISAVPVTVVP